MGIKYCDFDLNRKIRKFIVPVIKPIPKVLLLSKDWSLTLNRSTKPRDVIILPYIAIQIPKHAAYTHVLVLWALKWRLQLGCFSRSYSSRIPRKCLWYLFEAAIGTFFVSLCDDSLDSGLKFTEMQVLVTTYAYMTPERKSVLKWRFLSTSFSAFKVCFQVCWVYHSTL